MPEQLTAEETAALDAMKADAQPDDMTEIEAAPEGGGAPEPKPSEPVAAPVAQAEPAGEADPEKPPPGMVPTGALHQERERRKTAEAQFAELQRKLQEMEAKLSAMAPKPAEPEIVVPDPILEPEAFRKFQIEQVKARAAEAAEIRQQQEAYQRHHAMMARLNSDVAAFKATTPDYDAAFRHAVETRKSELAFYGNDEAQIAQQLEADVQALVTQAYAKGRNPAEMFYEYAQMRGYVKPAAVAAPNRAPAAQVVALAEAQRQTATIGTAGGPSSSGGITLEQMARMSERELAALPKGKMDDMLRKAMGA